MKITLAIGRHNFLFVLRPVINPSRKTNEQSCVICRLLLYLTAYVPVVVVTLTIDVM